MTAPDTNHARLWAFGLLFYATCALADIGVHLHQGVRTGESWLAPANVTVAITAGLFWPADLVARALLRHA